MGTGGRTFNGLLLGLIAVLGLAALALILGTGNEAPVGLEGEPQTRRDPANGRASLAEAATEPSEPELAIAEHGASGTATRTPLNSDELEGPVVCSGRVTARASGEALAGVLIEWLDDEGVVGESRTDIEGEFEGRFPLASLTSLRATSPGYASLRRSLAGEVESRIQLALDRGCELVARLELQDSTPFEEVEFKLWLPAARWNDNGLVEKRKGDGSLEEVRFTDLRPGNYALSANIPTHGWAYRRNVQLNAGESLVVPLVIPRRSVLSGRVLTRDSGKPVVKAKLTLRPERQGVDRRIERLARLKTSTNVDGEYRFEGLGPGEHTLTIEYGGAEYRRALVLSRSGVSETKDFEIPAWASLSGRVEDSAGQAVAGARVEVRARQRQNGRGSWDTETDERGEFQFEQLSTGQRLSVRAESPKGTRAGFVVENEVRLEPEENRSGYVLTLNSERLLLGIVVDPEDRPIAGARLRGYVTGQRAWMPGEATSGETGEFQVSVFGDKVSLSAEAEGYSERWVGVTVPEGQEPQPVRVVMRPELSLEGFVLDPEQNAVPFARVEAKRKEDGGRSRRGGGRATRADEFGAFSLDGLREGDWKVVAANSGWVRNARSEVELTLPHEAPVLLELAPDTGLSQLAVTLRGSARFADGSEVQGLRFEDLRGGSLAIDGDRFEVLGVRPGRARFELTVDGALLKRLPAMELAPGSLVDLGTVEFEPSTDLRVYLKNAEGQAIRGARVELRTLPANLGEGEQAQRIRVRRDSRAGRYRLRRAPRGDYQLFVRREGYETVRRKVTVREQRVQDLRLTLKLAKK